MGPFTSWPSSKGKKAKKLSAALTKRLVFAVPTRAEILFFGAWPPFAASFLLVHVISKAIQSTFDISRPQHHRPVSNWPIGFLVPNVRLAIADGHDGFLPIHCCSVRIDRLQTIHLISDWISEANIKGESKKKRGK